MSVSFFDVALLPRVKTIIVQWLMHTLHLKILTVNLTRDKNEVPFAQHSGIDCVKRQMGHCALLPYSSTWFIIVTNQDLWKIEMILVEA